MTWLYILIDILIVLIILLTVILILLLINRKKGMAIGSLDEFRNDSIYEKSIEDQKRLVHIEEITEEKNYIDDIDDIETEPVDSIFFSSGYGELEESYED